MQKAKVICIILAIVLVSTGTVLLIDNLSSNATEITRPNDTISAVMDRPEDGVFIQDSAKENLYIAHGELIRSGGFKGQNKGTSTSLGIAQTVWSDRTVVGNNVFKQSVSDGLVKMGSQTYIWGENYVFRGMNEVKAVDNVVWQNTAKRVSKQTYEETYGYRFSELTGYILNDDTITNAYLESFENGVYKYRYVLDCETAPYFVLYEMRTNAGTKGFGTFTQAEIIVEMDGDWQIKTLSTDCKYKVPMLGGVDCEEHMTEVFYDIGYNGDLPNKDFFEPYLTAEIETPAEKEPDALNTLLEMFEPHLAKGKLNAQLAISNKGAELAKLKLSLGIDVANLSNITAEALLGDNLYLSYEQGELFATYGDFKGKTTVNGVMGLVSSLMPETDTNGFSDINFDELLKAATLTQNDGGCAVELPIKLGDLQINAAFNGVKGGDGYEFKNATVSLGDITIDIVLCEAFEVPERNGEYPEILGLLDIFKNGVISANVEVNGITADIAYDFANGKLLANLGDLQAVMQNDTVFAKFGEIKLKANFDEIKALVAMFGDMLGGLPETELPQINVSDVLAILSAITTETVENGVAFNLTLGDINVQLVLTDVNGKWNIGAINVSYGEISASVTPNSNEVTFPQIDETKYVAVSEIVKAYLVPVTKLVNAKNYGADINLSVNIGETQADVCGKLVYDQGGNLSADAAVSLNGTEILPINLVYSNNALYVAVNGVKVAVPLDNMGGSVSVDQIKQVIAQIYGKNEALDSVIDQILQVVETVKEFDISSINLVELISAFTFENGKLTIGINANQVGLGEFSAELYTEDGKIVANVIGLGLGAAVANLNATLYDNVNPVALPQTEDYVPVSAIVDKVTGIVENYKNVANTGVSASLATELTIDGVAYAVNAKLNWNSGLHATITLSSKGELVVAEIYLVSGILYGEVNGVRFAATIPQNGGALDTSAVNSVLQSLAKRSETLNSVLNAAAEVANNLGNVNWLEIVESLEVNSDALLINVNATQLGLGKFTVSLAGTDTVTVAVDGLTLGNITLSNIVVNAAPESEVVAAPCDDYTTNLKIVVDELNTIYANLDLLNGEYRLRLDNLNVLYKDGTIRINYNDDLLIKTNLAAMQDIIAKFNTIAGDNAQFGEDGMPFGSFDLQALLNSLSLVCDGSKATLSAAIMGLDVTLNIFNGEFEAVLPIAAINKVFVITADEKRNYCEFTAAESEYVAIEDVINDYFPTLEKLAKTKSWHFDINAEIAVTDEQNVTTQYLLSNSYVEFVYDKVNNVFELRASLDIKKQANGEWVNFKLIELAFFNNRVFVNYNGLKITLSLDALLTCLTNDTSLSIKEALNRFIENPGENGALVDELVTVVPQIKDAIIKYNEAKNQITETVATVKYSSILKKATYVNGIFELTIDGGIFVEGLGDVKLAFGHNGEALSLTNLELTYGSVSVSGVSASVMAKDEQESLEFIESYPYYFETDEVPSSNLDISDDSAKQSAKAAAYHINLDSIKQLLSAFVVTATDRSFNISGIVHVVMLGIVDANINLGVKVDITENNDVFITAKIERPKQSVIDLKNVVYDDYGGNSYLYYDSTTGLFNVIRNSYRKSGLFSVKMNENDYRETDIPTEVFSADIVGYILKMVNFSKSIEDKILGAINGEGESSEYGIEDIVKDYYYTTASKQFAAKVDLKPVSSSLGEATLKINHNDNYQLTSLNVQMNLISICNLTMDLNLNKAVVGEATNLVNTLYFW